MKFSLQYQLFAAVGLLSVSVHSAQAMPIVSERTLKSSYDRESAPVPSGPIETRGMISLTNCSASLVRTSMSRPQDHAWVLTNGHCYEEVGQQGFLEPGEVRSHSPSTRTMKLALDSSPNGVKVQLHATEVIYASMTKSDLLIYRLSETYADLDSLYHVTARLLSTRPPVVGESIAMISGYFSSIQECQMEALIPQLREGRWSFSDSIRYSTGCQAIPGTSGSPLVDLVTGEIVGINNTTNERGEYCTLDNPCEVDAQGNVSIRMGASYGQQTYWITTCLTSQGEIDLHQEGCLLFR